MKSHNLHSLAILILVQVLILFNSCSLFYSKQTYFTNIECIISTTENEYVNYTQKEWEDCKLKYEEFNSFLYNEIYN